MAYGQKPAQGGQQQTQQQGGGERKAPMQPTHDIVLVNDQGDPLKVWNEELQKEITHKVAAVWLKPGAGSGLVKFEDGSIAKIFVRTPRPDAGPSQGQASTTTTAQRTTSTPKTGPAPGGGGGGSGGSGASRFPRGQAPAGG